MIFSNLLSQKRLSAQAGRGNFAAVSSQSSAGRRIAVALILLLGAMFISCHGLNDPVDAAQPTIATQPANGFWNVFPEDNDTFELTVAASKTDSGTLSYQWYKNTSSSASGGGAVGTDSDTLTLNKSAYPNNGSVYFYVVVTNTNNDVDGNKTASSASDVAEVALAGYPDTAYTTNAIPEGLKGTWTTETLYGPETYTIDDTTFIAEYMYGGTIVGHRGNAKGDAGYITIKYTDAYNPASIGQFYVIHYKNLTGSAISLSGAYLGLDPDFDYPDGTSGKASKEEAEAVMTVSAAYFGMYSELKNSTVAADMKN